MENSRILLEIMLTILGESNITNHHYAIGGGTVLAEYYHHRVSKDIDVFVHDIQLLGALSPRLNDQSANALDYTEQESFISLTFPQGKIDFIAAQQLTQFSPAIKFFMGHTAPLEDAVEIVCKKMYFRGNKALPRDIFDLAIVYNSNRKYDLLNELKKMPDKVDEFKRRLSQQELSGTFIPYSVAYKSMLLPSSVAMAGRDMQLCKELIQAVEKENPTTSLN